MPNVIEFICYKKIIGEGEKQVKFFRKTLLMLLVTAMFVGVSLSNTILVVSAAYSDATGTTGETITVTGFQNEWDISDSDIKIPEGSAASTVDVTVYDSRGAVILDSTDPATIAAGGFYDLDVTKVGNYVVVYSVDNGSDVITSTTKTLTVTGTNPTMELEKNSWVILPAVTNYVEVVLPYPTVTDENGDEVSIEDLNLDGTSNLEVSVLDPSGNTEVLTDNDYEGIIYKSFTPDEDGIYVVQYRYQGLNGLYVNKSFTFEANANYDKNDITYDFDLSGSVPTSANQGEEVVLPSAIVRDSSNDNKLIDVYVEVTVEWVDETNEANNVDITVYDNYKFIPTIATTSSSSYRVTYNYYDFFNSYEVGNPINEDPYTYLIETVIDSKGPTPYAVANYDVADLATLTDENISYDIPSKIGLDEAFVIPAIYGEDLVSDYENITFSRILIDPDGNQTTLETYNEGSYDAGQSIPFTFVAGDEDFGKTGDWTVRYSATDEAGRKSTTSYKITVGEGVEFVDSYAPRILTDGSDIPVAAETGDVIEFVKPTAIDYVAEFDTNTFDTNVKVVVEYYAESTPGTKIAILPTEDEDDNENLLSFVAPSENVTILITATDDSNNIATLEKDITVLDVVADVAAPTLAEISVDLNDVNQGDTADLFDLDFVDVNYDYLSVTVEVLDEAGNQVSVNYPAIAYNEVGTKVSVTGGSFDVTLAGFYTITYTAEDASGNFVAKSYLVKALDTEAPSMAIERYSIDAELNETIYLPTPTVTDNGVEVDNPNVTITFVANGSDRILSYNYKSATKEFTPLEEGAYAYTYTAVDTELNETTSATITINVTDGTDPELNIDQSVITFPETAALVYDEVEEDYEDIAIPTFYPNDSNNTVESYSIEVEDADGESILLLENIEVIDDLIASGENVHRFIPNSDGVYTVTYTATDAAGNTTSETLSIKVGDTVKPTIVIANEDALKIDKYVGDELVITLDDLTVSDNKDATLTTEDVEIEVYVDGIKLESVIEDGYKYDLEDVSDDAYIQYTITDTAGNITVEKVYFNVNAEVDDAEIISTEVWGIILIIASILVLAGVVVYFIRSRVKI